MSITLEMSALSLGAGLVALFGCLPMFYFLASKKAYPGMWRWLIGTIANSLGLILISLRGRIPDFVSIVLANLFIVGFAILASEGLLAFVGRRQLFGLDLSILICLTLFFYVFSIQLPNYRARVGVFCVAYVFYCLRSFMIVWCYFPRIRLIRNWPLMIIFILSALWYILRAIFTFAFSGPASSPVSAYSFQRLSFLFAFGAIIVVISGFIISNIQRLINDLKKAEYDIKTLSGLLPVCASCRRIRDDDGTWIHLELYISKHSAASFSHGLCDECASTLHPDLYKASET